MSTGRRVWWTMEFDPGCEHSLKGAGLAALLIGLLFAGGGSPAVAQQPADASADSVALTLDAAVAAALSGSEEVRLARAQVALAASRVRQVRSEALPQLNLALGYTKTLASAFDTGGGFSIPDSLRFEPDTTGTLSERVRYLERRAPVAGLAGLGALFADLPFGQENAYTAGLTGSQLLYSGGRVRAASRVARSFRAAAELGLAEEVAEIQLQVKRAYWQALLAREMEEISAEALRQADRFLSEEELRLRAGRASELEVMRAEVSRDNLRPQLVQARNAAEIAMLNLKRLVDIPLNRPVKLVTELDSGGAAATAATGAGEANVDDRPSVRAAEEQVRIREQQLQIARGSYLPQVSLNMAYGRQLFPDQVFDFDGRWRTDWTVSVGVRLPLLTGFRRGAEMDQARVELEQSRLQLGQLREAVHLQHEQAVGERERARQAIAARERTTAVAQRVYDLTVLRYSRGLATQLEVSDARLALLQARTNLARAVAEFHIADAEVTRARVRPDDLPFADFDSR